MSYATAAEADDIWADDLLNRKGDADFLEKYIAGQVKSRIDEGREGSFAINIDADWGAGKTFFVDHFAEQLQRSGHIVARVNAWHDDYMDDPFVAVLASIDKALAPFVKKDGTLNSAWKAVKKGAVPVLGKVVSGVAKTVVRKYVGEEVGDLLKTEPDLTGDEDEKTLLEEIAKSGSESVSVEIENIIDRSTQKIIDEFNEKGKASEDFQIRLAKAIDAISGAHPLPFYVIIDELDRCRPSYAVALLERVKHLFGAPNMAFVFATNANQLRHSIAGQYGPGFDGFKYLKRFFEATYQLHVPDVSQFISINAAKALAYGFRVPGNDVELFMRVCFDSYGLKPRDIKRILSTIENVAIAWPHKTRIDLAILLPLAVDYYNSGIAEWRHALDNISADLVVSRNEDRRSGRGEHQFNVRELFQQFVHINSRKDNFKVFMNADKPDENASYVLEMVRDDWERVMNAGKKTSYDDLVALVAHAGSLASSG